MIPTLLSLQLALTPTESNYLSQVNAELRKHDNILLASPNATKLQLGKQSCNKLKNKSLLNLNLQAYSQLIRNYSIEKSTIRYERYMQWYSAISINSLRILCPPRIDKVRVFNN